MPISVKNLFRLAKNIIREEFAIKSYSQEGEDMILNRIFESKKQGFYVDIGAHHPRRFSNTYFFYKQGWSGINVEPNPEVIKTFQSERARDINLQCGISDDEGVLRYYYFNDAALNTFDQSVVEARLSSTPYRLIKSEEIPVVRLDTLLGKYLPLGQAIDFLSVDVEGFDFAVLKSNDWIKYRPSYVLAEVLNTNLDDAMNGEIAQFMRHQGYGVFARTYNTMIFCEAKQ